MPTFADFLTSPARDEIVLLELTGRFVLSGFIQEGVPNTNTYSMSFLRTEAAGEIKGDVYRRVTGVRENGTNLTERASLIDVNANASSWFWDEANQVLYVRSSTSADPDTFTAYQALVRFYFATKPIVLSRTDGNADTGIYHHPWLLSGPPELVERDNETLFGAKSAEGGEVRLLNGHKFWNTITAYDGSYRWKHGTATFLLGGSYKAGGEVLLRSQYTVLTTFQIDDMAANEEEVVVALKPLAQRLYEVIPKTPYFSTDYPNLGDGVLGTKKWVGYGRATIMPDLTDTSGNGIYTIADAATQTLFAVNSVVAINKSTSARTTLTLTTHYTVNLTACTLTIVDATYKWQDVEIEVDVSGKPDGAGSYLKTFADVVKDIFTTFLGVRASDIDTASFTQAALDDASEVSVWLKNPRSMASILATAEQDFPSLEQPVAGLIMQSAAGLWQAKVWDPNYDATALQTLRKSEFTSFQPEPPLASIFSKVQVYYNHNHATGAWSVEEASDTKVEFQHDTTEALQIYSFMRNSSDAQRLAQRILFIAGGQSLTIEFAEVGVRLAAHRARDRVLIDYDPAPVAAGLLDDTPLEVLELRRSFDPTLRVSGRLGNLRGIGGFVGRWTSSTSPDYGSASATDKANSGYWLDSSGYAVPSDPTTKDISRWW